MHIRSGTGETALGDRERNKQRKSEAHKHRLEQRKNKE